MSAPDLGFVWDPQTAEMTELSPLEGVPIAIDDSGSALSSSGLWRVVPGVSVPAPEQLGSFVDISDAGWVLANGAGTSSVIDPTTWCAIQLQPSGRAFAINGLGQVVGTADDFAVAWNPIEAG
jgi:hypothetical protein